jgi:type I restriction enzyme S subunit
MNNLNYGRLDLGQLRYCSHHVDGGTLLRRGDVLFNRTNSLEHVGKSAIWNDELQRATFASYLVRLNYDAERIDPRYLVEWLNYPSTRRRVRSIATVAVQQVNVNPTRLRGLVIDLPVCLDEQSELIATLDSCDARIDQAREAQSKLRKVKAGVVSRLIGDLASRWQ